MKQRNIKIFAGHLINNETHKPARLDEINSQLPEELCVKGKEEGILLRNGCHKPLSPSSADTYDCKHKTYCIHLECNGSCDIPNLKRFYDKYGDNYL